MKTQGVIGLVSIFLGCIFLYFYLSTPDFEKMEYDLSSNYLIIIDNWSDTGRGVNYKGIDIQGRYLEFRAGGNLEDHKLLSFFEKGDTLIKRSGRAYIELHKKDTIIMRNLVRLYEFPDSTKCSNCE